MISVAMTREWTPLPSRSEETGNALSSRVVLVILPFPPGPLTPHPPIPLLWYHNSLGYRKFKDDSDHYYYENDYEYGYVS